MTRSCPGRSLRRSRRSFGMTTWNFGDTLTVCMGLSYGNHIDTVCVCQYVYRSLYRTTVAQSYPKGIKTRDAAEGPERKPVRACCCTQDGRRTARLSKRKCLATHALCSRFPKCPRERSSVFRLPTGNRCHPGPDIPGGRVKFRWKRKRAQPGRTFCASPVHSHPRRFGEFRPPPCKHTTRAALRSTPSAQRHPPNH